MTVCPTDHNDTTCLWCGTRHVQVGWAHVCRYCWFGHTDAPDDGTFKEPF